MASFCAGKVRANTDVTLHNNVNDSGNFSTTAANESPLIHKDMSGFLLSYKSVNNESPGT